MKEYGAIYYSPLFNKLLLATYESNGKYLINIDDQLLFDNNTGSFVMGLILDGKYELIGYL